MNGFDAAVYLALAVATVTGFNTGLLRSAITILAYLLAMPVAIGLASQLSPEIDDKLALPFAQNPLLFFGALLITGMVLGKIARNRPRRRHWATSRDRRPRRRRSSWRGASRPDRNHAGADLRPAPAGKPAAGIHGRLEVAASTVGRRAIGRQVAASRADRGDRPPQERPAHLIGVASLLCVSAVAAPLSGPLDLVTVAHPTFRKSPDPKGER